MTRYHRDMAATKCHYQLLSEHFYHLFNMILRKLLKISPRFTLKLIRDLGITVKFDKHVTEAMLAY